MDAQIGRPSRKFSFIPMLPSSRVCVGGSGRHRAGLNPSSLEMPGAAMPEQTRAETEVDGNVAVAQVVLERMQESGARDRIKEWLFDALEDCGWTLALNRRATQFVAERVNSGDSHPDGDMAQRAVPAVADITQDLLQEGFGMCRNVHWNGDDCDAEEKYSP